MTQEFLAQNHATKTDTLTFLLLDIPDGEYFVRLRIDGKLKGNVIARGDGNSTLILSENALIIGNVTVPHIIANGTIKGTVRASERIELQPKAEVAGDIYYKVMEVSLGAVINGNLIREIGEVGKDKGQIARLKPLSAGSGAPEEQI